MSQNTKSIPSGFLLADVMPFALPPIHILDVGAWLEGEPVYQPLLTDLSTGLSGFEPSDSARAELERVYKGRGKWFPNALGDGALHTLYETAYPGCISLFRPNPQIIDPFFTFSTRENGNFHVIAEHQIQTSRLDDVEGLAPVDFVKLDIQGAELMALEHGMKKVGAAVVLQTEASFLPLYQEQPLFGDIHAFLRKHGFELHKFIDVTGRAFEPYIPTEYWEPTSQVVEADAVFVRSSMNLGQLNLDEILKAARILHDVYRSIDLVCALLHEHDQRATVRALPAYMDALKKHGSDVKRRFLSIKSPFSV